MKRKMLIAVAVFAFYMSGAVVGIAVAQDQPVPEETPVVIVAPTPEPVVTPVDEAPAVTLDEVTTPQDLLTQLLAVITEGTTLVKFAALLLVLTQFAKPIVTFVVTTFTKNKDFVIAGDTARYLSLAVQVIIWVLFIFFKQRGQEQQFTDLTSVIQGVLNSIAVLLPAAVATNLATSASYDYLNSKSVPGFHSPATKGS